MSLRPSHLKLPWDPLLTTEQLSQWVSAGVKADIRKFQNKPGIYRWLFPSRESGVARAYVGQSGNLKRRVSEYLDEAWTQIRSSRDADGHTASAGRHGFEKDAESQNVNSVANHYDDGNHVLWLRFPMGLELSCADVPKEVYEQFLSADNRETFFNSRIKDTFCCRVLSEIRGFTDAPSENRDDVEYKDRLNADYSQILKQCLMANRRWATVRIGAQLAWKYDNAQLQVLRVEEEERFHGVEVGAPLRNDRIGRVFLEHWAILHTQEEGYMMLNRNRSKWQEELRDLMKRARKKTAAGARR